MSLGGVLRGFGPPTIDENDAFLRDLLESDKAIDRTTEPWQLVLIKRGTGPLGTGQELMRQDIRALDGSPLTDENTIPGRLEAPE